MWEDDQTVMFRLCIMSKVKLFLFTLKQGLVSLSLIQSIRWMLAISRYIVFLNKSRIYCCTWIILLIYSGLGLYI